MKLKRDAESYLGEDVTDEKVAALRDLGTRLQNAVAEAKAA
jgi:hypothetical protein